MGRYSAQSQRVCPDLRQAFTAFVSPFEVDSTKLLHLQVLLDPGTELKKSQLHACQRRSCPGSVRPHHVRRNGLRRQMEVRRQKHVVLPRLPIVVPDAPQPMRALLSPLRARELDGLIRSHAPLRVDFPRLHHAVLDPPLESRHQVNPLRNQRIDPARQSPARAHASYGFEAFARSAATTTCSMLHLRQCQQRPAPPRCHRRRRLAARRSPANETSATADRHSLDWSKPTAASFRPRCRGTRVHG